MKIIHDQAYAYYPNIYMLFRSALSCYPTILNITGTSTVGNSSGYNKSVVNSGIGEYRERYHFYNNVTVDCVATLRENQCEIANNKFIKLINQIKQTKHLVEDHRFELCHARNIFTDNMMRIPLAMISLAHADIPDRKFIPFIDSCGQAVHHSSLLAFHAAIYEFIERQALIGSWLSGLARYQINLKTHSKLASYNTIIQQLLAHGELYAFEVGNHLPGYSVIIFYFSKSKKDIVHYAVGMATDCSPESAIIRAINELWQSYVFMYVNNENAEDLDQRFKYLNELIAFNNHATKNIIPYLTRSQVKLDIDDFIAMPSITKADMIDLLKNLSPDIYAYERFDNMFDNKIHICKIISPDFFLHMGIKMPLNLDNHYAKLLNIDSNTAIHHPIPFP